MMMNNKLKALKKLPNIGLEEIEKTLKRPEINVRNLINVMKNI